jgi:hypothetical protein
MKKIRFVIGTSVILFILLTAMLIAPINASTMTPNSSVQVTKLSANEYIIESNGMRMVLENYSDTDYSLTVTNQTGSVMTFDFNKNGTETTETINGVETLSFPIGQAISPPTGFSPAQTINQTLSPPIGSPSLPVNQTLTTSSSETSSTQSNSVTPMFSENYSPNTNYYPWDGLNFASGQYLLYPHDDRNSIYDISPYIDWSMAGNELEHFQMDHQNSQTLVNAGPVATFAVIGAVIGTLLGGAPAGSLVGALIGIVFGLIITTFGNYILFDEDGCMWYWLSLPFLNWVQSELWTLYDYAIYLGPVGVAYDEAWIDSTLYSEGYVRLGSETFFNQLGVEDPTVPQYWAASINSYSTYSTYNPYSAAISNPSGLCGPSPDGNFAYLYAGNYGDEAMIIANMNGEASGHVYLNGYSDSGYYSNLYVYVSNDGTNWYLLPNGDQIITANSAYYIDCGSYSNFQYVAVVGYDSGDSVSLHIDSVQVIQ